MPLFNLLCCACVDTTPLIEYSSLPIRSLSEPSLFSITLIIPSFCFAIHGDVLGYFKSSFSQNVFRLSHFLSFSIKFKFGNYWPHFHKFLWSDKMGTNELPSPHILPIPKIQEFTNDI